jgi:hypothetical protein
MLSAAINNLLAGDLNSIGLFLGFVGVLLVFFFGFPRLGVLNEGAYVEAEATPRLKLYAFLSYLGMGLIAGGFACQFLAVRPG